MYLSTLWIQKKRVLAILIIYMISASQNKVHQVVRFLVLPGKWKLANLLWLCGFVPSMYSRGFTKFSDLAIVWSKVSLLIEDICYHGWRKLFDVWMSIHIFASNSVKGSFFSKVVSKWLLFPIFPLLLHLEEKMDEKSEKAASLKTLPRKS